MEHVLKRIPSVIYLDDTIENIEIATSNAARRGHRRTPEKRP